MILSVMCDRVYYYHICSL